MQIDHISFSPSGGAGQVAASLASSQNSLGHDARLITLNSENLRSHPLEHLPTLFGAVGDEYVVKSDRSPSPVTVLRRKVVRLSDLQIRGDSIIHLHWVEGLIDHSDIKLLLDSGRKILWTMHDAAPFSGGCHATLNCSGFEDTCADCPQVKPVFRNIVIKSHYRRANANLRESGLGIVAPSRWLASQIERSSLFASRDVKVIKNPVAEYFFRDIDKAQAKSRLGIEPGTFVGIVIAAQLDNPLKRLRPFIETFNKLAAETAVPSLQLLVGDGGAELGRAGKYSRWVGKKNHRDLPDILAAADFLAVTSVSESSGLTIREASAVGVPSLIIENGGSEELVSDSETGFVFKDLPAMEEHLRRLMFDRTALATMGINARRVALQESHPSKVGQSYLDEYSRLGSDI
jgi:glycosyltransferase involved in cell wall biosynthesis